MQSTGPLASASKMMPVPESLMSPDCGPMPIIQQRTNIGVSSLTTSTTNYVTSSTVKTIRTKGKKHFPGVLTLWIFQIILSKKTKIKIWQMFFSTKFVLQKIRKKFQRKFRQKGFQRGFHLFQIIVRPARVLAQASDPTNRLLRHRVLANRSLTLATQKFTINLNSITPLWSITFSSM